MRALFSENKTLKKINSGKAAIGFFNYIKDPAILDIAGDVDMDFAIIDSEHAVNDRETIEVQILAALLNGVTPFVRVQDTLPYLMRNYMEMGAQGILVPHINTKEEAQRGQDALRYAPEGTASACRSIRADGYNPTRWMQYTAWASEQVSYIPLIEDPAGVDNIEEILTVLKPGRDMVMFGKADYAQSANAMNPDGTVGPEVIEAYLKVCEACRKADIRFLACPSTPPEGTQLRDVQAVIDEGCSGVVINTDQYLLADSLRRINSQCRSLDIRK